MILSVHVIFGSAVASLVPTHPVLGFTLGFVSHFALDAIPHRDYKLISLENSSGNRVSIIDDLNKKFKFLRDVFLVSLDALIGICLSFLFFFNPLYPVVFFFGIAGSLLPDFLTFVYIFIKHKSLSLFYNLHVDFIHSKNILKVNQLAGVFLQFCTLIILLGIIILVRHFL
jgi:hypothetical protein